MKRTGAMVLWMSLALLFPLPAAFMARDAPTMSVNTGYEIPVNIVIEAPTTIRKGDVLTATLRIQVDGHLVILDTEVISDTISVVADSTEQVTVAFGEVRSTIAVKHIIESDAAPQAKGRTPDSTTATVNRDANMRAGPGKQYGIVGVAPEGTRVDVEGITETADWYLLADGAWIAASLLDNAPSNIPTVTAPPPPPSPTSIAFQTQPIAGARKLTLGDGTEIWHKFSRRGPDPAENAWLRSEVAGFILGPVAGDDPHTYLIWVFDLSVKQGELATVKVTDATEKPFVTLAEDRQPIVESARWSGQARPQPATETGTPWLHADSETIRIFRYDVKLRSGEVLTIYQPAAFSKEDKVMLRQLIR